MKILQLCRRWEIYSFNYEKNLLPFQGSLYNLIFFENCWWILQYVERFSQFCDQFCDGKALKSCVYQWDYHQGLSICRYVIGARASGSSTFGTQPPDLFSFLQENNEKRSVLPSPRAPWVEHFFDFQMCQHIDSVAGFEVINTV